MADIYNTASNTLISGTGSNDYIEIDGYNVTVYGFAGNDTIRHNYSTGNNTILGGKGNDSILLDNYYDLESKYVSIVYTSGDGNDVIEGFDMDDTLIAYYGKSYYKKTSGDDVIVSVDDSNITLRGAAILRYTNVDFRKTEIVDDTEETSWKLDGTTATYGSLTCDFTRRHFFGRKSCDDISGFLGHGKNFCQRRLHPHARLGCQLSRLEKILDAQLDDRHLQADDDRGVQACRQRHLLLEKSFKDAGDR